MTDNAKKKNNKKKNPVISKTFQPVKIYKILSTDRLNSFFTQTTIN